jgi:hypothetical protein
MTTVDNKSLPLKLVQLYHDGIWMSDFSMLYFQRRLGTSEDGYDYEFQFLWLDQMRDGLVSLRQFVVEQSNVAAYMYALGSSSISGAPVHLPLADVDLGLELITAAGDPLVWLDYRSGPEPCVLFLRLSKGPARWEVIAPDFKTFAKEWLGVR